MGKEGLHRLMREAHALYVKEVLSRKKTYKHYVSDFRHSVLHHDAKDAWSRNEHEKNYYVIVSLLDERKNLIRNYFSKETLSDDEISELLGLYYNDEPPPHKKKSKSDSAAAPCKAKDESGSVRIPLDETTIDLIMQVANRMNLFKEKLDRDDYTSYLEGKPRRVLTARNNALLALFFDKLASLGLIASTWKVEIARGQLIKSSSGKKFLGQGDFSTPLNRIRDMPPTAAQKRLLNMTDELMRAAKVK